MTLVTCGDMIHIDPMRLFILFISAFFLLSVPAHAEKHKDELKKVETDLKTQKEKQQDLARTQGDIEKKLNQMRSELMATTSEIQKHEQAVLALQDQRHETETQIEESSKKLDGQRESLARTIMALQRLNRMPPQALLARPNAPIDMARSFELLQKVIPAVAEQAQEIKTAFTHLQELHDTQKNQEQQLLAEREKLTGRQDKLEKIVKERQALLQANQSQQKDVTRQVANLANRATTLKDLLRQIQIKPIIPAPAPDIEMPLKKGEKPKVAESVKEWFGSVVNRFGNASLPVTGRIATAYGQSAGEGIISQGLTINAAPGSIVTAPSAGVVRFAGPFRQYKLLVIVQHPNGEHSLLGGMQELYTRTGARVSNGEPLGKLPGRNLAGDSASTSLYYERRRNGKPIDPRQARG